MKQLYTPLLFKYWKLIGESKVIQIILLPPNTVQQAAFCRHRLTVQTVPPPSALTVTLIYAIPLLYYILFLD